MIFTFYTAPSHLTAAHSHPPFPAPSHPLTNIPPHAPIVLIPPPVPLRPLTTRFIELSRPYPCTCTLSPLLLNPLIPPIEPSHPSACTLSSFCLHPLILPTEPSHPSSDLTPVIPVPAPHSHLSACTLSSFLLNPLIPPPT